MSEQQEDASGSDIFHPLKDAFDGIPIEGERKFWMNGETYHKLRQCQIESLLEQVEKLKVRRDNWRGRYEQAKRDLDEHIEGRAVLAEIMAHNPVARELERERDEARAETAAERKHRRRYAAVVTAIVAVPWVAYAIARVVLS